MLWKVEWYVTSSKEEQTTSTNHLFLSDYSSTRRSLVTNVSWKKNSSELIWCIPMMKMWVSLLSFCRCPFVCLPAHVSAEGVETSCQSNKAHRSSSFFFHLLMLVSCVFMKKRKKADAIVISKHVTASKYVVWTEKIIP